MIPNLTIEGMLPPGIHKAWLWEVRARFGISTPRREKLYAGLVRAISNLMNAGVTKIYINGSFVTSEAEPNDIDGCWDPIGVKSKLLDPVFLDFSNGRKRMKQKFGVDFFISTIQESQRRLTFQEFFQMTRDGERKGILLLAMSRRSRK